MKSKVGMCHVRAEKIESSQLKPGDLYSRLGPEYWNIAMDKAFIGEPAYIRSNVPEDADERETVYKLTVWWEGQQIDPTKPPGYKGDK